LKPSSIILEGDVQVSALVHTSWDFSHVLAHVYWLGANMRFRNFWSIYFEIDRQMDFWDLREARDGAAVQRAGGWSAYWFAKTDPRKRVWFQTNGAVERRQHGRMADVQTTIAIRPTPAVEIDILPHGNWTFGDPRWYDTTDGTNGSHTYYFAELDSRVFDATLRISYAFAPTLTLQAYAQLFVDGGHYGASIAAIGTGRGSSLPLAAFAPATMPAGVAPDFADGAINVNAVLRWELQLGSTLQLVYTHAQVQTAYDPSSDGFGRPSLTRFKRGPGTDLFLVKLTLVLM
jgi:hypothetical protein